jgi:superfamily II DNA/RNA helicase
VRVEVSKPASTAVTITQMLVATGRDPEAKRETLRHLIRSADGFKNAIVFCNRKREVAQLHRSLLRHKFNAVALHGDLDQSARTAALDAFRKGDATLLIASDVAARGLDIPAVSHIFNFDVPHHPDDYVHRIGRTGRAGLSGTAISIVAPIDGKAISAIEKLIGQTIPWSGAPAAAESHDGEHRSRHERPRGGERKRGGHHDRAPQRAHAPRQETHQETHQAAHQETHQETGHEPRQDARRETHQEPRQEARQESRPASRHDQPRAAAPRKQPPREAPAEDLDGSHLPAFLLRPISLKA